MFNRKNKFKRFKYKYGRTPSLSPKELKTTRYHSKKLQKRSHPAFVKAKKLAFALSIIVLTVLGIHTLFFSDYMSITQIEISDKIIEGEGLGDKVIATLSSTIGKNLLFTDTDDLELTILDHFPEVEIVDVEKDFPRTLIINFTEYPLVANIINKSSSVKKTYVINSIGYSIKEDMESPNLPYIRVESDEPLNKDTALIEANKLRYILETIVYFEEKFGMRVVETVYKKIPREINLITEKNFSIWLDIQKPADEQLKKLKKALVKLDIYTENLEYIDLRIAGGNGDKIIYKRR